MPFQIDESLAPLGASLSGENRVSFRNGRYLLEYSVADTLITAYEVNTNDPLLQSGLLRVREVVTNSVPVGRGGTRYRTLEGSVLSPSQLAEVALVTFEHRLWPSGVVSLSYEETVAGTTTQKRYDLEVRGKTLVVHAYAVYPKGTPRGNYVGFSFGQSEDTPALEEIVIPYMEAHAIVVGGPPQGRYFFSRYLDWTRSNSNFAPEREGPAASSTRISSGYGSQYVAAQDGRIPSFDETVYVTVSFTIDDAMLNVNRPPSPYRADLNDRVVLDLWGESLIPYPVPDPSYGATYQSAVAILQQLKNYGMDRLAIIFHPWQSLATISECGLPIHYPAAEQYGGEAAFRKLIASALESGYLVALHENYTDIYSNSGEYWADGSTVRRGSGGEFLGEFPRARGCPDSPVSYTIASDRMAFYAAQESPKIKKAYQTNAAFLDVTTAIAPDFLVDYASTNPNARTIRDGLAHSIRLNAQQQALYQGPLFGEGNASPTHSSAYQAGSVDGVEAEILHGELAAIIPDFELRVIKRLQANQGMGYHGRWLGGKPGKIQGHSIAEFPWDRYRAMQIAYGHTGFMGDATFGVPDDTPNGTRDAFYKHWIKEYYLFRELQWQYLGSAVEAILYRGPNNALMPLSEAVVAGVDFYNPQIHLSYENGLDIYLNLDQDDPWVVYASANEYVLPPNGWVAVNESLDFVEYLALVDARGNPDPSGVRVNYVRSSSYIMVDARGSASPIDFGLDISGTPIVTDRMMVVRPNGWRLVELPGDEFRVSHSRSSLATGMRD